MSDKKHIDRIFQEKLKDFEATPNPEVWKNIQNKLEKPKEDNEKVFPIWLRIASIAALLLVLLTIGNLFNTNKNNTNVVDTENAVNASETENINPDTDTNNSANTNNAIVEESSNAFKDEKITTEDINTSEENNNKLNSSIANSNSSNTTATNNNTSTNNSVSNKLQSKKTFKNATGNKNNVTTNKQNPLLNTQNESSLYSNVEIVTTNNTPSRNQNNNTVANIVSVENSANQKTTNINGVLSEREVENNTKNSNNNSSAVTEMDTNKIDSELKNNTKNTVAENSTTTEEENTTTNAETKKEETTIEEEIAKAEALIEKEEDEKVNRWQVYANIAPVYYNTLGKGSHIDEQFVDNSKSGETNTSYGVNVSYAFNKKLKLRSGVNSLNLSYDTDNVILYQNVSGGTSATLKNINFNNQGVSAISANNLGVQQALGLLPNENAAISQRIGYYEIPMELEYTLSNKRFGVNVIAGMSTLVLNDNKIFTEFEGRKTEIGEANNINNVSFSGNLGIGLDYKFSDKVKFNVQPTFKYQMNAYENTSGDFRPYIVGIYTGLSYQF